VQLVFDPFDLTQVEIRWHEQSFGTAAIHTIGTHIHPDAAGQLAHPDDMPPVHSGIDYLALVAAEHQAATRRSINFADMTATPHGPATPAPSAWDEPPLPFPDRPDPLHQPPSAALARIAARSPAPPTRTPTGCVHRCPAVQHPRSPVEGRSPLGGRPFFPVRTA
jgi:hypothetical protein